MESTDELIKGLVDLESPLQLAPKEPDKCPVFAVFYAEFDIKKGPVVRHQSPQRFLDRSISTTTNEIHEILKATFDKFSKDGLSQCNKHQKFKKSLRDDKYDNDNNPCIDSITLSSNPENLIKKTKKGEQQLHLPVSALDSHSLNGQVDDNENETTKLEVEVDLPEGENSIFDSTSEYIITGSELTGKIITLSTHDFHVMTRPTQITNEIYERNALLFSIGTVLRRSADPRPFRSLITKLALTLRSMEVENGVLSDPVKAGHIIQPLLDRILISMNSSKWECNLLLDSSTSLNLKLFHPPKPPAIRVHKYQVPVLLVRDFQLGCYEWDLAINWVILHIDGITNARQISVKAEVDVDMVLACLRVLLHHCVICLIDVFLYSNRYECTERAAAMLAGKEDTLLQEAVDFAAKRHQVSAPSIPSPRTIPSGTGNSTNSSPKLESRYFPTGTPSSSYPPRSLNLFGGGGSSQRSTNFRHMMAASSLEREQASSLDAAQRPFENRRHLKVALAELYCGCNRNSSFGDLWLSLTTELPTSLHVPNLHKTKQRGSGVSSNYQRSTSTRKDSLTEYDMSENEVVAFSPIESSHLESLRYGSNVTDECKSKGQNNNSKISSSSSSLINWKEMFEEFDHRRFITFGVVNGLLIRAHSYPILLGPFPERRHCAVHKSSSSSSFIISETTRMTQLKRELAEEKNFYFAKSVASMMDGTNFDDELVCTYEKPFNHLVFLVEKYSGKKVAHIYATKA